MTSRRIRTRANEGSRFETSSANPRPLSFAKARVSARVRLISGRTIRPLAGCIAAAARRPGEVASR
jgi:hypothetical protein